MNRIWAAVFATTVIAATLTTASATPAIAASNDEPAISAGSSLAAIQRAGATATERRIDALTTAIERAEGSKHLTDTHQAAVLATLNSALAGMRDLADEIEADTTAASALEDYRAVFTDYRVFAVVLPQSLYTAGADALTESALPRLHSAYDNLGARDLTPELEAKLTDMATKIAEAEAGSATLADEALAVTPASWGADNGVLADIRMRLGEASADAREAARIGREIAEALR